MTNHTANLQLRMVNIRGVCELLLDDRFDTDVEAIAGVVDFLSADECINVDYDYIIEADRQTGWDDPAVAAGFRQYTYMACTQVDLLPSNSFCSKQNIPFLVRLVSLVDFSLPTVWFKFPR